MNRQKWLQMVDGKIYLVPDIFRFDRARRDEDQKKGTQIERLGDFIGPFVARVNSLVIPNSGSSQKSVGEKAPV